MHVYVSVQFIKEIFQGKRARIVVISKAPLHVLITKLEKKC